MLDDRKLPRALIALCDLAIQMKNFQGCRDSDDQQLIAASEYPAFQDFDFGNCLDNKTKRRCIDKRENEYRKIQTCKT